MSDLGTGTTIVFATSSFTAELLSVSSSGLTREAYDTTDMSTTGSMTKAPKKLIDQGSVEIEFAFDPDAQPPISGPTETITITFPLPDGQTTAATLVGSGFITGFDWSAELEERNDGLGHINLGCDSSLDGFSVMLTAENILQFEDSGIEPIGLPEWGGSAYIRTMSGSERDSWEMYASKQMDKSNNVNIRAKLACICLCDENGKRLFGDGQVEALGKKSSKPLDRIYSQALKLNKLTDEEIETIEKN